MLKIALLGYGKMGKAIEEIALQKGHEIVLRISIDNLNDLTQQNLKKADVAIEFSDPESAFNNILFCLQNDVPVISGTTGWLHRLKEAEQACTELNGSFLYASNFSVGVNIFFELNKKLASIISPHPEYQISLEEVHHLHKKDAPSGTAITLAEQIIDVFNKKDAWVNSPTSRENEIEIISKRTDEVPGTHVVKYSSEEDEIEITHKAHNRKGFATGAVLAAEFIAGKKGIFSMKDVLQF